MKKKSQHPADTLRQRAEALLAQPATTIEKASLRDIKDMAQELAIHQAELVLQNEELREAQAALLEARDRFGALFERAPAGYVVLDPSGLILQTNATWGLLLDRPGVDFRGKPFVDSLFEEDAPLFMARFRAFFRNPADKRMTVRLKRQGQAPLFVQIEACPRSLSERRRETEAREELMIIVSDISQLQEARQQIETQNRALREANEKTARLNSILRAIRNVNQLITKEDDRDRLLQGACRTLTEELSYASAWIVLLAEPNGSVQAFVQAGFHPDGFADLGRQLTAGQRPLCVSRALQEPGVVVIEQPPADCGRCPLAKEYKGLASISVRLSFACKTYGVVSVAVPIAHAHDPEEHSLFEEMASDLAFALHKCERIEAERDTNLKLRQAVQGGNIGLWDWSLASNTVRYSPEWKKQIGYTDEEIGDSFEEWKSRLHPEDREAAIQYVWNGISTGRQHYRVEFRLRHKDGSYRNILAQGTVFFDAHGRVNRIVGSHIDLTESKQQAEAIAVGARYLEAVFEAIPEGLLVLDAQGCTVEANPAYCAMSGYSRAELLQRPISDLDALEKPHESTARTERIRVTGAERFETLHRRKDGTLWPVEASCAWLEQKGGRAICFCRDITERKKFEAMSQRMLDELRIEKDAAERANRAKDDFLAVMSHEMRTPLNVILGFANLMLSDHPSEEAAQFLHSIVNAGERQLSLIDNILHYAQLDRGSLVPKSASFLVRELCQSALTEATPAAHGLDLFLQTPLPGWLSVPPELAVVGDQVMLSRLLGNLLGNACKYTVRGSVVLSVGMSEPEANGSRRSFRFEVADTGIGIDPSKIAHLFRPFSQVDSSYKRQFEGAGLGLAICRKLVEIMGGQIGVESTPGQGSRFWFVLPLETVPAQSPDGTSASARPGPTRLPGILHALIVDDRYDNALVAQAYLQRMGATSVIAGSGSEALALCAQATFDLILMDLAMPEIDGLETTRRLRTLPNPNQRTPVVAMTADATERVDEVCRQAGIATHLTKPIRAERFYQIVQNYVRKTTPE